MNSASVNKDAAIAKIVNMPEEQVLKVLIFMAGMEAGETAKDAGRQKAEVG